MVSEAVVSAELSERVDPLGAMRAVRAPRSSKESSGAVEVGLLLFAALHKSPDLAAGVLVVVKMQEPAPGPWTCSVFGDS